MEQTKPVDSPDRSWVIVTFTTIVFVSIIYMVVAFFRMDRVAEQTVDRYWSIQAMECSDRATEPVLVFSQDKNTEPEFALRYSRGLYEHLTNQKSESIPVDRKLFGYLQEWDYGVILVTSVAQKRIRDSWRIIEEHLTDCSFHIDDEIAKAATSTRIRMR